MICIQPEKWLRTAFSDCCHWMFGEFINVEIKPWKWYLFIHHNLLLIQWFLNIGKVIWIRKAEETVDRRTPECETSKCHVLYICALC